MNIPDSQDTSIDFKNVTASYGKEAVTFVRDNVNKIVAGIFLSGSIALWMHAETPKFINESIYNKNLVRIKDSSEAKKLAKNAPWEFLDECKQEILSQKNANSVIEEYFSKNKSSISRFCTERLSETRHMNESQFTQFIYKEIESVQFSESDLERFFHILTIVALIYFWTMYPAAYLRTNYNQMVHHIPVNTESFMTFAIGSILGSMSGFYQGSSTAGMGYAILAAFGLYTAFYNEFILRPKLRSGEVVSRIPGLETREKMIGKYAAYIVCSANGDVRSESVKCRELLHGMNIEDVPLLQDAIMEGFSFLLKNPQESIQKTVVLPLSEWQRVINLDFESHTNGKDFIGVYIFLEDITDDVRYKEIIEHSSSPIVSYDTLGKIEIWNPAMEELTGYTKDEIIEFCKKQGVGVMDILYPEKEERAHVDNHLAILAKGGSYNNVCFTLTRKDGQKRAVLWSSAGYIGGDIRIGIDATNEVLMKKLMEAGKDFHNN